MGGSTPLPAEGFSYLRHSCYSLRVRRLLGRCSLSGPGHFCPAPHVAMGVGLYLFRCSLRQWDPYSPSNGTPRTVSEDPAKQRQFPADCPHRTDFHCLHRTHNCNGSGLDEYRRILGCSSKQWGFITAKLGLNRYSYGRRLPGLRFRASSED
jgi:hypothetical protein